MMNECLTWFPYKWIRRTQYIPEFGGFYNNLGILLGGCLTGDAI